MDILLTSGGTKVMLDEVRNVGNMSQGTFGDHICRSFLAVGQKVRFLYAKDSKAPHEFRADIMGGAQGAQMNHVKEIIERMEFLSSVGGRYSPVSFYDFDDYYAHLITELTLKSPDIVVFAAAVSDFRPINKASGKIDSDTKKMSIEFEQTPKLIRKVKELCPNAFLVGFKLLVGSTQEELEDAMRKQIEKAGCDLVVGNDIRDIRGNNHKLTLMHKNGKTEMIENRPGSVLAQILVQRILCAYTMRETQNAGNAEAEL